MAVRNASGIAVEPTPMINNIFVNTWKGGFFSNPRMRLACIPFMRNLIEYTKGEADPDYIKLTSLLHWKPDTATMTQQELDQVYHQLFGAGGAHAQPSGLVFDSIQSEADGCIAEPNSPNLERKLILSIAIRMLAEKFMLSQINDPAFEQGLSKNQTYAIVREFRSLGLGTDPTLKTLEKMMLTVPENIHLNSFMYEPIIDLSDDHLRMLYSEVKALI